MRQPSVSLAGQEGVVRCRMRCCSPNSRTLIESRVRCSSAHGLAHAHIHVCSALPYEPMICAGAQTIFSGNVKTNSPVSCEKSHRSSSPKCHTSWCATVWSRKHSTVASKNARNSALSPSSSPDFCENNPLRIPIRMVSIIMSCRTEHGQSHADPLHNVPVLKELNRLILPLQRRTVSSCFPLTSFLLRVLCVSVARLSVRPLRIAAFGRSSIIPLTLPRATSISDSLRGAAKLCAGRIDTFAVHGRLTRSQRRRRAEMRLGIRARRRRWLRVKRSI